MLAVVVALVYGAVARWLSEYELYAEAAVARAHRLVAARQAVRPGPAASAELAPRRLFGLAFESRPPPVAA